MGRVKIKIALTKWFEGPRAISDYILKEIEVPFDTQTGSPRILGVSTIDAEIDDDTKSKGYIIDQVFPVLTHNEIDRLVGKLLTYIDATFTDQEQRKAHKDILRSTLWDWYADSQKGASENLGVNVKEQLS